MIQKRVVPNSDEWLSARDILLEILPSAKDTVTDCFYMTPDRIAEAAKVLGHRINWVKLADWELHESSSDFYYEDDEIFELVFGSLEMTKGKAVVIPDYCFRRKENPFITDRKELKQFIDEFPVTFFDGDVIFLFPLQNAISLFHHEGVYAHLSFDK